MGDYPFLLIGAPGRTRTCYPQLSLLLLLSQPHQEFVVWTISSPLQVPHV